MQAEISDPRFPFTRSIHALKDPGKNLFIHLSSFSFFNSSSVLFKSQSAGKLLQVTLDSQLIALIFIVAKSKDFDPQEAVAVVGQSERNFWASLVSCVQLYSPLLVSFPRRLPKLLKNSLFCSAFSKLLMTFWTFFAWDFHLLAILISGLLHAVSALVSEITPHRNNTKIKRILYMIKIQSRLG